MKSLGHIITCALLAVWISTWLCACSKEHINFAVRFMHLEPELATFLKAGRQLDYNPQAALPGKLKLVAYKDLTIEEIHVEEPTCHPQYHQAEPDPDIVILQANNSTHFISPVMATALTAGLVHFNAVAWRSVVRSVFFGLDFWNSNGKPNAGSSKKTNPSPLRFLPDECRQTISSPGLQKYYRIPAVNLSAKAGISNAGYILLWLPNEKLYATWDNENWRLFVFPGVSWNDIVKNPLPYVNAQWKDPAGLTRELDPTGRYDLVGSVSNGL